MRESALLYRRYEFEAGVFLRIGEVDGFGKSADQSHNPLIESERNSTTARLFQTARRHQVIAASVVIGEINRADLGIHRLTNFSNQHIQRLVEARSTCHFLDDFSQPGEHVVYGLTSFTSPGGDFAASASLQKAPSLRLQTLSSPGDRHRV